MYIYAGGVSVASCGTAPASPVAVSGGVPSAGAPSAPPSFDYYSSSADYSYYYYDYEDDEEEEEDEEEEDEEE